MCTNPGRGRVQFEASGGQQGTQHLERVIRLLLQQLVDDRVHDSLSHHFELEELSNESGKWFW